MQVLINNLLGSDVKYSTNLKNPIIINTAPNKIDITDIISFGFAINNTPKNINTSEIIISVQVDLLRNFSNMFTTSLSFVFLY